MSRDTTLPTGVVTAATAPAYQARHAVRIGLSTPLLFCEAPGPMVINGETYLEGALSVGQVEVGPVPTVTLKLVNGNNEISSQDADNNAMREAQIIVYEVMWDPATGAQLNPVVYFVGVVNQIKCTAMDAELQCISRVGSIASAGMVGRYVSRLCPYVFCGARCGVAVPPAPVNLIVALSPDDASWEVAGGNWCIDGPGTTQTRITTDQHSGVACNEVVCDGTVTMEGITLALGGLKGGATYTFSVWVKLVSGQSSWGLEIYDFMTSTVAYFTATTSWVRYQVTKTIDPSVTVVVLGIIIPGVLGASAIVVDDAQFELGSVASSPGPQAGCDHTMATCLAHSNLVRFGGWPSMPPIGQIFMYEVANGTTVQDTAGTLAPTPNVNVPDVTPPPATTSVVRKVLSRVG